MDNSTISPLDSRYAKDTQCVKKYFTEYAFFKYRLRIELEYFKDLLRQEIPELLEIDPDIYNPKIDNITKEFTYEEYLKVKELEKVTNHDVKALEYYIRERFTEIGLGKFTSFVHIALTSQDVNNSAVSMSIMNFVEDEYLNHYISKLMIKLHSLRTDWKKTVMLSRTHGQPAVPTTMGHTFSVFHYRLEQQLIQLKETKYYGKFGGASGNLNAHKLIYPYINWEEFGEKLLGKFNLLRSKTTTQIDSYDSLATVFDNLARINRILINMCQDIWMYIMLDYLKLKAVKTETGSSTMPHKVNPINFENAEGNLKWANYQLYGLSDKLQISRLYRDLSDSTVLRNLGVVFGHILVAINNIMKGLDKIDINQDKIDQDIEENYSVVSEAIQTVLRKYGKLNAYEQLKDFCRGNPSLKREDFAKFIQELDVDAFLKYELEEIDLNTY